MDRYTAELAVWQHIGELTALQAALYVAKARRDDDPSTDVSSLEDTIKRELADLAILLEVVVSKDTIADRLTKFAEKARKDKKE